MTEDETKVLIVQLEQLNERSRWYGARRWQMPFAYLAVAGLVISRIPYLCGPTTGLVYVFLGVVYVFLGALGVAVSVTMRLIAKLEDNAVDKLSLVEDWLKIPIAARAQSKKEGASKPLSRIVIAAAVLLLTIGILHVAGAVYPILPLTSECTPVSSIQK